MCSAIKIHLSSLSIRHAYDKQIIMRSTYLRCYSILLHALLFCQSLAEEELSQVKYKHLQTGQTNWWHSKNVFLIIICLQSLCPIKRTDDCIFDVLLLHQRIHSWLMEIPLRLSTEYFLGLSASQHVRLKSFFFCQ